MARYSDNALVGHTCPLIDKVISFLDSIDCEEVHPNDIKTYINVLEEIRSANDALRTWGNELYKEKDEMESDYDSKISDFEKTMADLETEISDYKDEIKDLKSELVEAEKQLDCAFS